MNGGRALLDSEAPPWLVFGDWANSVHWVLRFALLINEKLNFWICFACLPFWQCLPKFLGRSVASRNSKSRDSELGLSTFPTPWFAWALSAGVLAVLIPVHDPSKMCHIPACISLCLSWLHGGSCLGFLTAVKLVCFDLFTFCLVCIDLTTWSSSMICRVSPSVLGSSQPVWLSLPHSALCAAVADLSVTLSWSLSWLTGH